MPVVYMYNVKIKTKYNKKQGAWQTWSAARSLSLDRDIFASLLRLLNPFLVPLISVIWELLIASAAVDCKYHGSKTGPVADANLYGLITYAGRNQN